jgi:hypothetical protein
MYPHSAMVGGGTRAYYPNAMAQNLGGPVPPAPRRRMFAAVAWVLRRRAPSRSPSPLHPSVMSKAKKSMRAGIAALLVIPLLAGTALGDVVTRRDPKDTPGRLDIRRISHGHAGDGAVVHTISTYRRFPSRLLKGRGGAFGVFLFDPDEERIRLVVVRWRNGRLRAPVFDWDDGRVGTARVSRPNPRTVRLVIPKGALGSLGEAPGYSWFAVSMYRDGGACKHWCEDVAPNRRPIRHVIEAEIPPEEPPEETPVVTTSDDLITRWLEGAGSR